MRGLRLKFTKDNPLTLSRRFEDALAYATVIHAGQLRKGGQYGVSQQILTDSARDNLDIFWLKDTLEDSANLHDPDIIAAEIVEDLQAALAQFAEWSEWDERHRR
jgi:hypothetical protein